MFEKIDLGKFMQTYDRVDFLGKFGMISISLSLDAFGSAGVKVRANKC